MAKGTKRKSGATNAPKSTIEELSDDQRYSLAEQHREKYEILLAAKKKATNELQQFGIIVKADLGKDGLDQIKAIIEGKTPEGEAAIKARIERDVQVLRWLGVPIGTQTELFPTNDRTPITERSFAEGKRQGLAGENNNNPHHHTTEAHRAHNDGYAKGQEINASRIKKLDDTPKGSVPREQWQKQLRENNDDVERQIKESAAKGSSRSPSYEMN